MYPLSKKYFDLVCLFTRDPFVKLYTQELGYYTDGKERIACICSDSIDSDFSAVVLSRDNAKQFRAEAVKTDFESVDEARKWIENYFKSDIIAQHDYKRDYFDVFKDGACKGETHPNFTILKDGVPFGSAKKTIQEISYHYQDIDGNFIEQFQSKNGFDSRLFEMYLYCFFREQEFNFSRKYDAPDYMIDKMGQEIAVEAVIVSRTKDNVYDGQPLYVDNIENIISKLSNEIPLKFASVIYDKSKKRYWEKEHVKGKPFVLAIADFHADMSMTYTFNSLVEYLYGYNYDHTTYSETGELIINPRKVKNYIKENGTEIPSGFFLNKDNENISAVIFSATATLSKFNRIGKQVGFGSTDTILHRTMVIYNHEENADKPIISQYTVNKDSNETWSEGVVIYHNPYAKEPLNPNLFDETVAQAFYDIETNMVNGFMPQIFPYSSFTRNIIFTPPEK